MPVYFSPTKDVTKLSGGKRYRVGQTITLAGDNSTTTVSSVDQYGRITGFADRNNGDWFGGSGIPLIQAGKTIPSTTAIATPINTVNEGRIQSFSYDSNAQYTKTGDYRGFADNLKLGDSFSISDDGSVVFSIDRSTNTLQRLSGEVDGGFGIVATIPDVDLFATNSVGDPVIVFPKSRTTDNFCYVYKWTGSSYYTFMNINLGTLSLGTVKSVKLGRKTTAWPMLFCYLTSDSIYPVTINFNTTYTKWAAITGVVIENTDNYDCAWDYDGTMVTYLTEKYGSVPLYLNSSNSIVTGAAVAAEDPKGVNLNKFIANGNQWFTGNLDTSPPKRSIKLEFNGDQNKPNQIWVADLRKTTWGNTTTGALYEYSPSFYGPANYSKTYFSPNTTGFGNYFQIGAFGNTVYNLKDNRLEIYLKNNIENNYQIISSIPGVNKFVLVESNDSVNSQPFIWALCSMTNNTTKLYYWKSSGFGDGYSSRISKTPTELTLSTSFDTNIHSLKVTDVGGRATNFFHNNILYVANNSNQIKIYDVVMTFTYGQLPTFNFTLKQTINSAANETGLSSDCAMFDVSNGNPRLVYFDSANNIAAENNLSISSGTVSAPVVTVMGVRETSTTGLFEKLDIVLNSTWNYGSLSTEKPKRTIACGPWTNEGLNAMTGDFGCWIVDQNAILNPNNSARSYKVVFANQTWTGYLAWNETYRRLQTQRFNIPAPIEASVGKYLACPAVYGCAIAIGTSQSYQSTNKIYWKGLNITSSTYQLDETVDPWSDAQTIKVANNPYITSTDQSGFVASWNGVWGSVSNDDVGGKFLSGAPLTTSQYTPVVGQKVVRYIYDVSYLDKWEATTTAGQNFLKPQPILIPSSTDSAFGTYIDCDVSGSFCIIGAKRTATSENKVKITNTPVVYGIGTWPNEWLTTTYFKDVTLTPNDTIGMVKAFKTSSSFYVGTHLYSSTVPLANDMIAKYNYRVSYVTPKDPGKYYQTCVISINGGNPTTPCPDITMNVDVFDQVEGKGMGKILGTIVQPTQGGAGYSDTSSVTASIKSYTTLTFIDS